MSIQQIIEPDATIAGGVKFGGQVYTVRHNQLSGNTEGKRRRLIELMLDNIFDTRIDPDTFPIDDPVHPDNPENPGVNTYSDLYRRPDDSLIDERTFYWRQNPANLWMVFRSDCVDIILVQENDPTLGGNDRYALRVWQCKGF